MTAPPPHPSAGLVARALLWCALAVAAAAAVWWPWSQGRLSLQTDLLALLPSDSRNPTAEQALDTLAARTSARALFLVGSPTREQAGQAATGFAQALRQHPVWAEVRERATDMDPQQLLGFYAEHRFMLMTASDREALRTGTLPLTDRLLTKMHTPMAWSPRLPLAQDPLGLTDTWLSELPLSAGKLRAVDGQLVTEDGSTQWVLVQATLQGSPWAEDVQQAAVDATTDAGNWLRAAHPAAQSLHTGPVFHAEASRRTAQHEAQVLGAIATAATLLIVYVLLRSMRPVVLSALCIGFGVLVAVAVTAHTQGHIHLITLVFGVSLIGEAADYAAQYLAAQLGAGPEWDPQVGLRQVAPGLVTALGTSALAYTGLWMTPLPALSQIGLFALAGLVAACASVFLLLPALLRHPSKRPPNA